MNVTEIRDGASLADLRTEWDALLQRCPKATIYQTWEWNHAWWMAFHRRKSLRLLLIHDGDTLVGIAPLYTSLHLGTPFRRMAFLGTGASDYLDVIVDGDRETEACRAMIAYLSSADGYDLADLQQLPEWSPVVRAAHDGPSSLRAINAIEVCPYVPLTDSWDTFSRSLSKRFRSNIGYYDRLLRKASSNVEYELAEGTELDPALSALFDLHGRRWRSRMMPGVLCGARTREFHRDVAHRFLERGWLRLHTLRVDGRIVAALYCFSFRRRYYYYLGGFDPTLGRYSIGTTLTAAAIRAAIEEDCTEFDFLRGHEAYKYRWMPHERTNVQALLTGHSDWRAWALFKLNGLERWVERRAKSYSDRRKAGSRQEAKGERQKLKEAQTS